MENKFRGNIAMTKLKLLWIDDDADRKKYKRSFETYPYKIGSKTYKADVEYLMLHGLDVMKEINNFNRFSEFDLILVDHVLSSTIGKINRGTTFVEIIKENLPDCPIIGITAVKNREILDLNVLSIYDDLFFVGKLEKSLSSIFTIASTFKVLKENKINDDLDSIVGLFKSPNDDVSLLKQILPVAEINLKIKRSNVRMLSRWTLHNLIEKPGLLYDIEWAANLAGIKKNSFHKIEKLFLKAKYSGIFCNNENPRWWKSKIKEIIFEKSLDKQTNFPWEAGHYIPGISKKDYSICYYCKELFPETMGFVDTTEGSSLVPLHFRHSQPHPSYRSELYFDEILLMKDIKK
jgi:hypothetical protein